jgi:sugar phosphate isomerase/epimerase
MLTLSTNIHDARLDGSLAKLPGDLERIRKMGLGGVEIGIHGLDAILCGRLDDRRMREFRAIAKDYPLRLSFHAPDSLDLMSDVEPELHRAVLHSCLEFCAGVGSGMLVVHPGRWVNEADFGVRKRWRPDAAEAEDRMEEEAELLREAAEAFPSVCIALENARPYLPYSPYTYAEFPDQLLEQISRVARRNVRVCLDTGHLHMSSRLHKFDEAEAVRRLSNRIVHLHVHDNFGRTGNWTEKNQTHLVPFGRGDLHMPPGMGDIDFNAMLSELLAEYSGIVVCELRGRYLPELEDHIAAFKTLLVDLLHETPTAFVV